MSHWVGGIIVGEDKAFVSTVFHVAWPEDVQERYHKEVITNSELECDVLLLLWLFIEEV